MSKITEDSGRGYPPVIDLEDFDSDLASLDKTWCSEESTKKIRAKLKSLIKGNTDCFSRIDIKPLYKKGTRCYYRAVIYMRDYLQEGFMPVNKISRSYYIAVEGKDYQICSANPHLTDKI